MGRIPKGFISLGNGDLINSNQVKDVQYDSTGKTLILNSGEEIRVNNYKKEEKNNYEAY